MTDTAAADAVRNDDRDAFEAQQGFFGDQRAMEVLVGRFAAFVGMLPDVAFGEFGRGRAVPAGTELAFVRRLAVPLSLVYLLEKAHESDGMGFA